MSLANYSEWHGGLTIQEKGFVRGFLSVGKHDTIMVRIAVHFEPWRKDVAKKTAIYETAMKRRKKR